MFLVMVVAAGWLDREEDLTQIGVPLACFFYPMLSVQVSVAMTATYFLTVGAISGVRNKSLRL